MDRTTQPENGIRPPLRVAGSESDRPSQLQPITRVGVLTFFGKHIHRSAQPHKASGMPPIKGARRNWAWRRYPTLRLASI